MSARPSKNGNGVAMAGGGSLAGSTAMPSQSRPPRREGRMSDEPRGWGWPGLSKKAHYFINRLSLCRKWAYAGPLDEANHKSLDNCKQCMTIRNKMAKAAGANDA